MKCLRRSMWIATLAMTMSAAASSVSRSAVAQQAAQEPVAGSFRTTGQAAVLDRHTATLLQDGTVLIVSELSAQLYDPATGLFTATGGPSVKRSGHTATLLANGKVLVAGGFDTRSSDSFRNLRSAELYDPSTGTFSSTGAMAVPRAEHLATLLPDGRVLLAGGKAEGSISYGANTDISIYDPESGTFSSAPLREPHYGHVQTLLPNGNVLIGGGWWAAEALCEIYDAATQTLRPSNLATPRYRATGTTLDDGRVLIAGGRPPQDSSFKRYVEWPVAAELLAPETDEELAYTGSLQYARYAHAATLLPNSSVLITGGRAGSDRSLAIAEIYDPATGTFSRASNMTAARSYHTATLLLDGRVLIVGGGDPVAELFTYDDATPLLGVPESVAATTVMPDVEVTWNAVPGATAYEILRYDTPIAVVDTTSFLDTTTTINSAYWYSVRAIDSAGVRGPRSDVDFATTYSFTDDPIIPNVTEAKAVHIAELIAAAQSLSYASGFGGSGATPPAAGQTIRSGYLPSLRSLVNEARAALGLPPASFTTNPAAGQTIRAADIQELRDQLH